VERKSREAHHKEEKAPIRKTKIVEKPISESI